MGNLTGNADKKTLKAGKMDKTNKKRWNMLGQKGKGTLKNNDTT